LTQLVNAGVSPREFAAVEQLGDYDLYDVLADIAYGLAPKTKSDRAEAFSYKHADWLNKMPEATVKTVEALVNQFVAGGTEALENPLIFQTPGVSLGALKVLGKPGDVLREIKERIFAAS
jgi:type I restriction enzyme, R subunit